jgi:uncharacterized protein
VKLKISPTLSLPIEFVTSTQAILAKKGKGKTYKASVQAEEMLEAGQQVVVIDPTGAWWGLRSSADGKSAGYPISIFGGEHADIELAPTAGEVIADAIATEHFSAVIDLTLFRKSETLRFMTSFLETLYRKNRDALHLFIDEADVIAPQRTFGPDEARVLGATEDIVRRGRIRGIGCTLISQRPQVLNKNVLSQIDMLTALGMNHPKDIGPDEARVLGATEDIVRRGRIRGIGCTLISQRPQVLNKNVLSQIDMLTALGMNHPKDIGAVRDWVAVHGDERQAEKMIAELPSLPQGEAWVWNPAADIFKRITFRDRHTFDSGKTPKAGGRKVVPKVLASVDIEHLGKTIAATVEQQKANDPRALKTRVTELEKQLAAKPAGTKIVEKPIVDRRAIAAYIKSFERVSERLTQAQQTSLDTINELKKKLDHATPTLPVIEERRTRPVLTNVVDNGLPVGESKTLAALIQYPKGLRRDQLTVLTGYKRSTRDAYIARLKEKKFVETNLVHVYATRAGIEALPNAEPLPSGAALQTYWLDRLPAGERGILVELLNAGGGIVSREILSDKTGYKRSTRDAYLARLSSKELVVVGHSAVRASPTLFEAT